MHSAEADTSLDVDGMPAWHLKMSVQLYDLHGKPAEQGTVEEWWAGPEKDKVIYKMPTFALTEVHNGGKTYLSDGSSYPPAMMELLLEQAVHPMPDMRDSDAAQLQAQKVNFGKAPLECIMLAQPIHGLKTVPIGLFPTYCFDPGKDSLRVTFNFGTQLVIRNGMGRFRSKSVALDTTVKSGELTAASAHIFSLNSQDVGVADLSTDGLIEEGTGTATPIDAKVMSGLLVNRPDPVYPADAKTKERTGTVILHAIIGRDGHIRRLTVVSSPYPDLAVSAIAAVRQWTYKPYRLNGAPVEIETTITVNYAMN